jgi:16S rRNA (adenine1518-N6/adenine1519-N6)-dimethyltransferase
MIQNNATYHAKKKWGQHFLVDTAVIANILAHINPRPSDNIVEIGPGTGAITQLLVDKGPLLHAIEVDAELALILTQTYAGQEKVTIHNADILQFDFTKILQQQSKLRIVGNLPYNIGSQIIMYLVTYAAHIQDMIFMLQQEVVNALVAQPGVKAYSRLSVMAQYNYKTSKLFDIAPDAFTPAPAVISSMIKLTPYTPAITAINYKHFTMLVKTSFMQRRKTLKNNLKKIMCPDDFATLQIDSSLRAEMIGLKDYIAISNYLQTKQ